MRRTEPVGALTRLRLGVGALTLMLLLMVGAACAGRRSAQGASAAIVGVESIGMTVSDLDRAWTSTPRAVLREAL